MTDTSMQDLVTDVEKELLNTIVKNLDEERMTVEQARQLAREFLALLPMQDKQDLLAKLYKLSQKHFETKSLYLRYAQPQEEEERQRKLTLMSHHIKDGKIDHAIAVAKGGTING